VDIFSHGEHLTWFAVVITSDSVTGVPSNPNERRLARALGTERVPVTGERAGADFVDGVFAYQAKLGPVSRNGPATNSLRG